MLVGRKKFSFNHCTLNIWERSSIFRIETVRLQASCEDRGFRPENWTNTYWPFRSFGANSLTECIFIYVPTFLLWMKTQQTLPFRSFNPRYFLPAFITVNCKRRTSGTFNSSRDIVTVHWLNHTYTWWYIITLTVVPCTIPWGPM